MSLAANTTGTEPVSQEVDEYTIKQLENDSDGKSTPSDPSTAAEKGQIFSVTDHEDENHEDDVIFLSHEEQFPIDPDAQEEPQQFTVRAVLVGCILGGVIAASK